MTKRRGDLYKREPDKQTFIKEVVKCYISLHTNPVRFPFNFPRMDLSRTLTVTDLDNAKVCYTLEYKWKNVV